MASELRVDTLKDSSGNNSVGMAYVSGGSAKQWTNINGGSGTPAVRDSFNNSSLTDNGTGDYTLALSSSMNNADYALQTTGSGTATGSPSIFNRKLTVYTASTVPTTSQYRLASGYNYYTGSGFLDNVYNFTEVQGDLA